MIRRPTTLLLALFVGGCAPPETTPADDTGTGTDTGTDTVIDTSPPNLAWYADGTPTVAAPAIPWSESGLEVAPPEFACREGWTATELDNGATICEPWPSGAREVCDSATAMHLPGTDGCVEVGAACPAGDWAEALPGSGVWYVSPGGTGDGTSMASPLGSVAAAIAAAAAGDTVALAKGTYDEAITVTGEVRIQGACAAETTLTASAITEADAVVTLDGGTLALRDLQVSDAPGMGLSAAGGTLDVDGVAFVGNTVYNAYLESATVTVNDALFAEGRPRPSDGLYGYGLTLIGGTLELTDSAVVHNTGVGVKLKDGTASIDGLAIAETEPRASDLTLGDGIELQGTEAATLTGLVVEDVHYRGIGLSDEADATLSDSVVRGVAPQASDGGNAYGVTVVSYARLAVERSFFDRNGGGILTYTADDADDYSVSLSVTDTVMRGGVRPPGLTVGGFGIVNNAIGALTVSRAVFTDNEGEAISFQRGGMTATLTDIRAERSGAKGNGGAGIYVAGADVTVERASLVDNATVGIVAMGAASVTATDVYVAAPALAPGSMGPAGIFVTGLESLALSRVLIEDVAYLGLYAELTSAVTVSDLVARRVAPDADDTYGVGVVLNGNDAARLERADVSDTRLAGVDIVGIAEIYDLRVTRTTSSAGFGYLGVGVLLESAQVTGARWVVEDSQNAGVGLNDSALTVSDVLVDGVAPRPCVATTCPEDGAATGVYLDRSSTLELSAFLVQDADGVGVQSRGTASLTDGYIREAPYAIEEAGNGLVTSSRVDVSGATAASPTSAQPAPTLVY
ncbi:MAG: right-handed parallel beta-helix repeat-containing protein [Pseudomonadota bacterium]|nr:right-handed parallel beta-helix repeat-containing protein [Pseudomonadota bacterium]